MHNMTDKELHRLRRDELLEILLSQQKEIDRLTAALAEAEQKLADREITIMNAGSIAEASLALTDIFAEAQRAADLYIENVRRRTGVPEEEVPEQKAEEAAADEAAEEVPAETAEETITEEAGKPQEEEVKAVDTPEGGETSV